MPIKKIGQDPATVLFWRALTGDHRDASGQPFDERFNLLLPVGQSLAYFGDYRRRPRNVGTIGYQARAHLLKPGAQARC